MSTPSELVAVDDLAAFLSGRWLVERHIDDLRLNQRSSFSGQSVFAFEGSEMVQHDEGTLSIAGHDLTSSAVRRYSFDTPGVASVMFEDGREFHDLDLRTGAWNCTHNCADDVYRGHFVVKDHDTWTLDWDVVGPSKQVLIRTVFRPRELATGSRPSPG